MTIILLATAVPALLAFMHLGLRRAHSTPLVRSLAHARGDTRGIALQTVIIIVVLLAIAGTIAGVLLSTGADVASELEGADTTGQVSNQAECVAFTMGREPGAWSGGDTCTWQHDDVSTASCRLVGGSFTATTNAANNSDGDADNTDDQCELTV